MSDPDVLRFGPLGTRTAHLCVDMQRLFAEGSEWAMPWFARVLPRVRAVVSAQPEATIFTRFIPAVRPGEGRGTWQRYYERWSNMTLERLGREMIEIVPELRAEAPNAPQIDKVVYSPWLSGELHQLLQSRGTDTIVVTGGETDVCVLATVLGAVDLGYRVVIVTDALCSSSDATHDALLTLYQERYHQQVEAVTTASVLRQWP